MERVGGTRLRGLAFSVEREAARGSPSSELGTRTTCVLGGNSTSSAEVRDASCFGFGLWETLLVTGRSPRIYSFSYNVWVNKTPMNNKLLNVLFNSHKAV